MHLGQVTHAGHRVGLRAVRESSQRQNDVVLDVYKRAFFVFLLFSPIFVSLFTLLPSETLSLKNLIEFLQFSKIRWSSVIPHRFSMAICDGRKLQNSHKTQKNTHDFPFHLLTSNSIFFFKILLIPLKMLYIEPQKPLIFQNNCSMTMTS